VANRVEAFPVLWNSDNMKALSNEICEGSGKEHLLSHVDEPNGRGTCGHCRQTMQFELVNGAMVPPVHFKPAKPKGLKKRLSLAKNRNPTLGRNRSGR
jgi:hypothetical protein